MSFNFLSDSSYDLIVNRHTAIHMGLYDNIQMFYNFYQSGSAYLLTTTFPNTRHNTNLFHTDQRKFHEVNLEAFPFLFPPPRCRAEDSGASQQFGLWQISRLADFCQS